MKLGVGHIYNVVWCSERNMYCRFDSLKQQMTPLGQPNKNWLKTVYQLFIYHYEPIETTKHFCMKNSSGMSAREYYDICDIRYPLEWVKSFE